MKRNVKENLVIALDEPSSRQNHLNTAYLHTEENHNRNEVHTAFETTGSTVDST